MEFTCLSKGRGSHFPPCHILNLGGIKILLDCPLDLSALTPFSPVTTAFYALPSLEEDKVDANNDVGSMAVPAKRQKIENQPDNKTLIFAEPWYKTVMNLHLWNPSFIDVVLISSPMGILGLPFLTQMKGFSAKIYATEVSARLGELVMRDLVSMHKELKQFYGPTETDFPVWLRQEEVEKIPSVLREIILGKDGTELGGLRPLYSEADVNDCVLKIQKLKYAEEVCYNGILVIKAFSSGVEMGSCNWILDSPKGDVGYLSNSSFISSQVAAFDYQSLQGTDTLIYSDFSSLNSTEDVKDEENESVQLADKLPMSSHGLVGLYHNAKEDSEEMEKLAFICSCAIESIKGGGSVFIPINQFGIFLQLLEEVSKAIDASAMKVPIYIISSVAEDLLAYLNIVPEWLSRQRQERLFDGEPLFDHVKLLDDKKIHVLPNIHSEKFWMHSREPCIVFCSHWSLRLGPVVHLLQRWHKDPKSLLILEGGVNPPQLALLPFKPMAMKVLQCHFQPGIGLRRVRSLLETLQPKTLLFPEEFRPHISFPSEKFRSVLYYSEGKTSKVSCKDGFELKIPATPASNFYWNAFKEQEINLARVNGELIIENARYHLLLDNTEKNSNGRTNSVSFRKPELEKLLATFSNFGINASVEHQKMNSESQIQCLIHTADPYKAVIEIGTSSVVITTAGENVASHLYKALDSVLKGN
ncbi:hypothetical protein HN51_033372 [Arachis hypogaea]|nr:integrator complex subunit 9 homolog isoform X2 [Arachis hypogaea]XP_025624879.1 integrator complex subunit 9 homolog isoform X2 [Arachis hypogaea]QHO17867.1 uncharacterized protein DS421_10g315740 [Arachis hypogaea]QHO17868.1 uncharacterized protein DS421_10g315740 [Arachis hypogaea]